jgi:Dna[CI] antecedent, DciA
MRGTRSVSDILSELITIRGYGRLWTRQMLENAWNAAIGEPDRHQTQIGDLRHGVLNVIVTHASLLDELSAFRKAILLTSLRSCAPGIAIHDIRFRVGSVTSDVKKALEVRLSVSGAMVSVGFCPPLLRNLVRK